MESNFPFVGQMKNNQGGGAYPAALSVTVPYPAPAGDALPVWMVGTDIEQGSFTAGNYAILGIIVTTENPVFSMRGVLCNFSFTVLLMN